jgi:hypothetical protein
MPDAAAYVDAVLVCTRALGAYLELIEEAERFRQEFERADRNYRRAQAAQEKARRAYRAAHAAWLDAKRDAKEPAHVQA